uniref:Nucleoporin 155 n=1 Tax=Equus caballus TaxID=9796 RepID=A0A9L0TUS9_HORSE
MPSSLLGSAMPASTSAAALQEALENAGRLIDRQLQEDRMYPDLSELLMVSAPRWTRRGHLEFRALLAAF